MGEGSRLVNNQLATSQCRLMINLQVADLIALHQICPTAFISEEEFSGRASKYLNSPSAILYLDLSASVFVPPLFVFPAALYDT